MLADLSAALLLFSLLMYVALDGTDLGVGMLFAVFHSPQQRTWMTHSLLPLWDANETWLVLFAGGLLALFPPVYSLLLHTMMVPLMLFLMALFLRAFVLAYRAHATETQRVWLDRILMISSLLAAFLPGWMCGQVLVSRPPTGIILNAALTPLLCGLGLVAIDIVMGCCWLCWRIGEAVTARAHTLCVVWWVISLSCFICVLLAEPALWQQSLQHRVGLLAMVLTGILWLAQLVALWREAMVTLLLITLALIGAVTGGLAAGLYPWLIPQQMDIQHSASSNVTQYFVITGMLIVLPLTVIYHSWSFKVFKSKG